MNIISETRYGRILHNEKDIYVGASLAQYGEYSQGEADLFEAVLRPGDVAFDVGANVGYFTACMARRVGPSGHVVAFEPERGNYYNLCGTVALNNYRQVFCRQAVVADSPGTRLVPDLDTESRQNFGGLELERDWGNSSCLPVPQVTLDQFDLKFAGVRLLKADVEGMELKVLRGAEEFLKNYRPFLYVEADRAHQAAPLLDFLRTAGYACWVHEPIFFNTSNYNKNGHNIFGKLASRNLFCVLKGDDVPTNLVERFGMTPAFLS